MAQEKGVRPSSTDSSSEGPAGGTDRSQLPQDVEPGWTVKFTFHSAKGLPPADLHPFSSDPYVLAYLKHTNLPKRHIEDPQPSFRSHVIRKTLEPQWEAEWIVANCPQQGFEVKARLFDEDPSSGDDSLGSAHIWLGPLHATYHLDHHPVEVRRRSGSWRAYGAQRLRNSISRDKQDIRATLVVSVQVLGRTEAKSGAKAYTVGPNYSFQHYSPLIGRVAGTKGGNPELVGDRKAERYDFEANQIQLTGPVPDELYQRYVAFKPWVTSMFTSKGLAGKTLHYVLRKQHGRIYHFDEKTTHSCLQSRGRDLALQFLKMAHFDEGGRIFTYAVLLDGIFRFTETGKEFGIDLLSKHTMHSCVATYTAFSGEFFIRRVKDRKDLDKPVSEQTTHPPADLENGPPNDEAPQDPSLYELIIDNDSGTYRPAEDLLPSFQEFLERNFAPLRIIAKNCADEELVRWKAEQHEVKKREGDKRVFVQPDEMSSSESDNDSIISSAEDSLDERIQSMKVEEQESRGQDTGGKRNAFLKPKSTVKKWFHKHTSSKSSAETKETAKAVKAVV